MYTLMTTKQLLSIKLNIDLFNKKKVVFLFIIFAEKFFFGILIFILEENVCITCKKRRHNRTTTEQHARALAVEKYLLVPFTILINHKKMFKENVWKAFLVLLLDYTHVYILGSYKIEKISSIGNAKADFANFQFSI